MKRKEARRRDDKGARGVDRGTAWPAVFFFLRFVAMWLAALLAISWFPGIETMAIHNTASALGVIVALFVHDVHAVGSVVSARGVSFEIVADCTPLMPAIVLAAACLAFPARWRWRLAGVIGGTVALWIYNQVRLLILFVVEWRWPATFDFIHVYLWQTFTLIVVFLLFVAWLRLLARPAARRAGAAERHPDEPGPLRRDSASPGRLR
jgi:exosortase/archaeosortase family protein